jgi:uncharacterized membrane protein YoaK (UPF0700 family)
MFRHQGKTRTIKHNLQIASLLSFVAGIVNVTGFLSIQRLTTNITGHFAFFVDEIFKLNFGQGLGFFLYICFFLLGSFVSGFLIELISRKETNNIFVLPTLIESFALIIAALFGNQFIALNPDFLAFSLLFAMGLQNALVTKISNSVVRTTHLTGLFTDLGIEISQLFFYTKKEQKQKLLSSIRLRMTIISFFFMGGIAGGVLYTSIGLYGLLVAAATLIMGLINNSIRLRYIQIKRKCK